MNVQGDEPLLDPHAIDVAVNSLLEEPQAAISTVATPIKTPGDIMDPSVVKAVLDFDGNAIYFSRAPIPWVRDTASKIQVRHLKHLGLLWKSFYRSKSARPDVAGRTVATRLNSSRLSGNRTRKDAVVIHTNQKNGVRIHSVGREFKVL